MPIIKQIHARQILDSRGFPTVEVDLCLRSNAVGRASVPSGASTGSKEALELRDGHVGVFLGKGVLNAVDKVNNIIANSVIGIDFHSQAEFDEYLINLDGTENKSSFGANAVLGVSLAFLKACAIEKQVLLCDFFDIARAKCMPHLMLNIINGGVHSDNALDIQEFMIIPKTNDIHLSLQMANAVFYNLKTILQSKGYTTGVGDEGGFAPNISSSFVALDMISEAINKSGLKIGIDINLGLDVASNELFDGTHYHLKGENLSLNYEEFAYYLRKLSIDYHITSIEDPMAESDNVAWQFFTSLMKDHLQIVGDDIFVTNHKLLQYGIENNIANAVLIKMNQIGTVTETLETIKLAFANKYRVIISHRSGETEDTSIAHLAIAAGADYIKAGSICRTDRVAKYNELLRINEQL